MDTETKKEIAQRLVRDAIRLKKLLLADGAEFHADCIERALNDLRWVNRDIEG